MCYGACVGHVSPEPLAGGPVGRLRDADMLEIVVDRAKLEGHVNFIGEAGEIFDPEEGRRRLLNRPLRTDLRPNPALPEDTRLWAVGYSKRVAEFGADASMTRRRS